MKDGEGSCGGCSSASCGAHVNVIAEYQPLERMRRFTLPGDEAVGQFAGDVLQELRCREQLSPRVAIELTPSLAHGQAPFCAEDEALRLLGQEKVGQVAAPR